MRFWIIYFLVQFVFLFSFIFFFQSVLTECHLIRIRQVSHTSQSHHTLAKTITFPPAFLPCKQVTENMTNISFKISNQTDWYYDSRYCNGGKGLGLHLDVLKRSLNAQPVSITTTRRQSEDSHPKTVIRSLLLWRD